MSPPVHPPRHRIDGFALQERLSETPATVIYRGRRLADDRPVIVKLPAEDFPSAIRVAQIRRELELGQRAAGPLVVEYLGAVRCGSGVALVMEDVRGVDLTSVLADGPMPLARFLELAVDLALGLSQIHAAGVVHRDVKPTNVLIDPDGRTLKWIDFGHATPADVEPQRDGLLQGTLAYVAPELCRRLGGQVDGRADLYSLGVTLYQLLTGALPFEGQDELELIHAHLAATPPPVRSYRADVPPPVAAVLERLLAKCPDDRYQTARGLAADLARCAADLARLGRVREFELGAADHSGELRVPERLYGRGPLLADLLAVFQRAVIGPAELVLLLGPRGVGKSSLVRRLEAVASQRRGLVVVGRSEELHRGKPYAALREALSAAFAEILASAEADVHRWRQRLGAALGPTARDLVSVVPAAAALLGSQPPPPPMAVEEAQRRLQSAIVRSFAVLASLDRPVVLFLDDLHWADMGTLDVVGRLAAEGRHLMIVATARVDEPDEADEAGEQPLHALRERLLRAGTPPTVHRVEPLGADEVEALLHDTLQAPPGQVAPLAVHLRERSGGSPSKLRRLLVLHRAAGRITWDADARSWRWDLAAIQAADVAADSELLARSLAELPATSQRVLAHAAVVGRRFDVVTVAGLVGLPWSAAVDALSPALDKGLIAAGPGDAELLRWLDPEDVRVAGRPLRVDLLFVDDRFHHGALGLLASDERAALHLRLADRLLTAERAGDAAVTSFDVADQVLAAGDEAARACGGWETASITLLRAARDAMRQGSASSAEAYVERAWALLPGDSWRAAPSLTRAIAVTRLEVGLTRGDLPLLDALAPVALQEATTPSERAQIMRFQLHGLMIRGQMAESFFLGQEALGVLDSREGAAAPTAAAVEALCAGREPAELVDLPEMTSPRELLAAKLLSDLQSAAHLANAAAFEGVVCDAMARALRHGLAPESAVAFVGFGLVCVRRGDHRRGGEFAEAGLAIARRFASLDLLAHVACLTGNNTSHWHAPLDRARAILDEGRAAASQAAVPHWGLLLSGVDLLLGVASGAPICELRRRLEARRPALETYDFAAAMGAIAERTLDALEEGAPAGAVDLEAFTGHLAAVTGPYGLGVFHATRALVHLVEGAPGEALAATERASEHLHTFGESMVGAGLRYHRALAIARLALDSGGGAGAALVAELERLEDLLAVWRDASPDNFAHMHLHVAGERARLRGEEMRAADLLDRAIRAARGGGFVHHAALACESAARLWRGRQQPTLAQAYEQQALAAYRAWGARARVEVLERGRHGVSSTVVSSSSTGSAEFSVAHLDLQTVMKASRALAREINLERLLARMMRLMVENTGAQGGALVLRRDDRLTVRAVADGPARIKACDEPLDGHARLPLGVVAYVLRTGETVIRTGERLNDAFADDPYLARALPRSVLCLPVNSKDEVVGALYLEHRALAGVFTEERLEVIKILLAQAAISLENAYVYANLDRLVADRAAALEEAQRQLLETARLAGRADVAVGVLHDVGNVLNSVGVTTELIRERVGALPQKPLARLAEMLQTVDPATFLTDDPRGQKLPGFLAALAKGVAAEQERLGDLVDTLRSSVHHMRAVVQAQQTHATMVDMTEVVTVDELIEDAQRLLGAALEQEAIDVEVTLPHLPPGTFDRRRVLEVLLNLLRNARDAVRAAPHREGRIRVEASLVVEEGQERVQIRVVDNGVGIAEDHLVSVFRHGFTTKREGHGFGLHRAANLAAEMNGELTVASAGPGEGATFCLEIPFIRAAGLTRKAS